MGIGKRHAFRCAQARANGCNHSFFVGYDLNQRTYFVSSIQIDKNCLVEHFIAEIKPKIYIEKENE